MEPLRNEDGLTLDEFLAEYDENRYKRPSCTADMILMTVADGKLKVLLIRRKNHPWIGDWAMPGGFVNYDEDLETAVQRELLEETNVSKLNYFRQLYTFGKADRDPRTRVITIVYLSLTPAENINRAKAGDDAADALWFTLSKTQTHADDHCRISTLSLVNEEKDIRMDYRIVDTAMHNYIETRSEMLDTSNARLAADHIKAINMAMDMVQHRAASTGILFNLLPEEATLREIQTAYEAVIGHETDTANFRRDVRKMLIPTGNTRKGHGKPAALYSFNPMFNYVEENL